MSFVCNACMLTKQFCLIFLKQSAFEYSYFSTFIQKTKKILKITDFEKRSFLVPLLVFCTNFMQTRIIGKSYYKRLEYSWSSTFM